MLPTTYPGSSMSQLARRFGLPRPSVTITLPKRSRVPPGRSATSESVTARSNPVTAVQDVKRSASWSRVWARSEEHTSELQSRLHLVCRLLLEKKKNRLHVPSHY